MALTNTEVTHPNSQSTEFSFGPFKAKIMTVTFDSQYLTTGEVVTAAQLGWDQVHFALPIDGGIANTAGTLSCTIIARPNTARTQIAIQAQETAGTVDTSHKEVTSNADLSTYFGRFMFVGS